jgi:cytochrome c biogenesis protein ResB
MIDTLWKFLTSLRLTVVLLALAIVLVFVGTVAQANEGLYQAQERYFQHWFVWRISMFGYKLPILLPGGYLIGTLLLINLTAAHIKRFQLTTKKLGIHLTHLGVILLLVGQLTTDLLSRETNLRFAEGESKSWSESFMEYELAFMTDFDADREQVVAIPQSVAARGGEIQHEKLPFTVRVKSYWPNSDPSFRAPMQDHAPPLTTNGVARHFDFRPVPVTYDMETKNVPTAVLELIGPNGSLGTWVAPGWAGDETMSAAIRRSYYERSGPQLADSIVGRLTEPQAVEVGGKTYRFALRPKRAYEPFSLTLLKTTHEVYPGTATPKDFRSRVRLSHPQKGEDREVEIYMNSPLRYGGLTFFQHQMSGEQLASRWGETPSSVLQVVRNPSWLTPYVGCIVVAGGLVIQFMIHLVGFLSRRKAV